MHGRGIELMKFGKGWESLKSHSSSNHYLVVVISSRNSYLQVMSDGRYHRDLPIMANRLPLVPDSCPRYSTTTTLCPKIS